MSALIYLDHNASTPCDPQVVEAMLPFFTEEFANPTSRNHAPGRRAFASLEDCRRRVAAAIGARHPTEVVFTSGATEANNTAILGCARALDDDRRHIVTQVSEHPAVIEPLRFLERQGWDVSVLPVDQQGLVDPEQLRTTLRPDTALVSIMLANNETGTIQPIQAISSMVHDAGALLHCDAAQAIAKIPVSVTELGADLLSISAHKFYGPKGIGALYRRRDALAIEPLILGGGQEFGRRSGTANLPAIVGMATALEISDTDVEGPRLESLRDRFEEEVLKIGDVQINGNRANRLPGTSNLSFAGIDGEALLASLPDIAISSGSACASDRPEASRVLLAMGLDETLARASLRCSFGRMSTAEEAERAAARISEEVRRLRDMSSRRTRRPK